MRAFLDDPIPGQHQDAVRMPHRRQPVGDDDRRPPLGQRQQRLLHRPLALVVERARRLVEDQDGRILEEGAGDGQVAASARPDSFTPRWPISVS